MYKTAADIADTVLVKLAESENPKVPMSALDPIAIGASTVGGAAGLLAGKKVHDSMAAKVMDFTDSLISRVKRPLADNKDMYKRLRFSRGLLRMGMPAILSAAATYGTYKLVQPSLSAGKQETFNDKNSQ